jgi:hypothetical protein
MSVQNCSLTPQQKEKQMTEPVATVAFYEARINELELTNSSLKDSLQYSRDFANRQTLTIENVRDNMKVWTIANLEDESIQEHSANEIAEICDFELTTDFEVEVTVIYNITVNSRNEESAKEAVDEIDFESVSYDSDSISWLSATIDRVDI